MKRALVIFAALVFSAILSAYSEEDRAAVYAEIQKRHDEAVQRLQQWVKQPSIAAENRGMNEGCELMMRIAREAGFQKVERIDTDGQPGVFATLDEGAARTVGLCSPSTNVADSTRFFGREMPVPIRDMSSPASRSGFPRATSDSAMAAAPTRRTNTTSSNPPIPISQALMALSGRSSTISMNSRVCHYRSRLSL